MSFIYFVADEHNRVKIGTSSKETGVTNRAYILQVGNADKLSLIGYVTGTEEEFHKRFSLYHVRGEWF